MSFAYVVPNAMSHKGHDRKRRSQRRKPKQYLHEESVALGTYELSKVQRNRVDFVTDLMDEIGLTHRAQDLGIEERIVKRVLEELPEYSKRHKFFYTVVDEMSSAVGFS